MVCHLKYKCWYTPEDEPEWAEKLFRYTLGLGATSALAPGNAEMFEMGCAFAPGRCCSPLPLPPPLLLLMLLLLCCTDSLGGDEPRESITVCAARPGARRMQWVLGKESIAPFDDVDIPCATAPTVSLLRRVAG